MNPLLTPIDSGQIRTSPRCESPKCALGWRLLAVCLFQSNLAGQVLLCPWVRLFVGGGDEESIFCSDPVVAPCEPGSARRSGHDQ